MNHLHCWEQKQPPACGLNGPHKRCCLCPAVAPNTSCCAKCETIGEHYKDVDFGTTYTCGNPACECHQSSHSKVCEIFTEACYGHPQCVETLGLKRGTTYNIVPYSEGESWEAELTELYGVKIGDERLHNLKAFISKLLSEREGFATRSEVSLLRRVEYDRGFAAGAEAERKTLKQKMGETKEYAFCPSGEFKKNSGFECGIFYWKGDTDKLFD